MQLFQGFGCIIGSMKNKITNIMRGSLAVLALLVSLVWGQQAVLAANVPSLIITPPSAGSSTVQLTVYGADANASALLYFPSSSGYISNNIGTTNQSGYLLTTINAATYGITAGSPVYVMVNGQQSMSQNWPSYSSTGSLSLSQTTLNLQAGQTMSVSAAVSASLSISSNSNPSVATATINGNQIVVTGNVSGTSNIAVCASGIGCSNIYVTVQSAATAIPASISFSQSSLTMTVGQSQNVTLSGSGSYYVSSNSNVSVSSASINGSTLTVNALSNGNNTLSVCASGNNSVSCGTITVNVTGTVNTTTTNSTTQNVVTFSPSSVNMNVGSRQSVTVYGSGPYYVSSNSNPSAVTANVNGSSIDLTGVAFGGANISVCQISGGCGNLYAYVAPTDAGTQPTVSSTSVAPAIANFSVSSNGSAGFLNVGATLTFTMNANQAINTPTMTVAGRALNVSGTGSGPYTASYTVTGNEGVPMPIVMTFTNSAGTGGQAYVSFGALSSSSNSTASASGSNSGSSAAATVSNTFTQYLYEGSTGSQVTALQQRLKALGVYSGPVTGTFGPLTKAAVKAYQLAHGLSQVGVVGPSTRALLNQGL